MEGILLRLLIRGLPEMFCLQNHPQSGPSGPGASGTNWWADPHEELVVVWMAYTPGPLRWKYREMINALVYQAIVD